MRFLSIIVVFLCLTGSVFSQEVDDTVRPVIADVFLAKADADGKAGERAQHFVVTDIPIYCVVRLHTPGVASFKMDFVAADVPGVKAGSKVVSISYTTKDNEDLVNFSGRPHGNWVAGKYRVDVFIGSKKVRNIEFEIKSSPAESANPTTVKPKAPSRKIVKRTNIAERYVF